jgi:hypothetical protein
VKAIYRMLSRLRGKRSFHPFGLGFSGRMVPAGGSAPRVPGLERDREVLVRLSRALGLPEWLPDPCGLAIRAPDAHGPGRHQDFLLVTSALPPGARHTILPSRGFADLPYSTVLPYRLRGGTVLLGARALGTRPGPKLEDLSRADPAALAFELQIAGMTGGWQPFGRLTLERRLPPGQTERLGFDPTNTGGELELAGWLNKVRGPAYAASQEGRAEAYGTGSD